MSLIRRSMMCNTQSGTIITYTTKDHNPVDFDASDFDGNVVSNTYNSVKDIGMIKFDRRISRIGDNAFNGNGWLTSINIPAEITYIGSRALYNNHNLTEIIIPKNVTTLARDAIRVYDGYSRYGELLFYSPVPPTFVRADGTITSIGDLGKIIRIRVPVGAVDTYKNSTAFAGTKYASGSYFEEDWQ